MAREAGAAVPLLLIGGSVLVAATAVAGAAVSASVTHTRSEAVADLAAIAGASALLDLEGPCTAAARVATENRARLVSCEVRGAVVRVDVRVSLPGVLAQLSGREEARATSAAELLPAPLLGSLLPQQR